MKTLKILILFISLILVSCVNNNEKIEAEISKAYSLYKSGNIDSALTVVHSLQIDELDNEIKKKIYNGLGEIHTELGNMDSSYYYQNKSIFIKEQMNDKEGLALSYNDLAVYYLTINSVDLAIENLNKAIAINEHLGIKNELIHNYMNLGYAYDDYHKYNLAISQYNKSLGLIENDTNLIKGDLYHNIAFAYSKINNKKKSNEYFLKALSYSKNKLDSLAIICTNLFLNSNNYNKNINLFLDFNKIALSNNSLKKLGYSYYFLSKVTNEKSKSDYYRTLALDCFENLKNYNLQVEILLDEIKNTTMLDKSIIRKFNEILVLKDQRNYESDLLVLNSQKKALEDNYKLESEIIFQRSMTWFFVIFSIIVTFFLIYIFYLIKKKKLSDTILSNLFYRAEKLKNENINQLNNKIVELMFKIDDYAVVKDRVALEKNLDDIVCEANNIIHQTNNIINQKENL